MSNCLILSCFVQMQTPTKNSELYLFDHSWTPFQKKLYRHRPEMIILPNWSDRCLRCCVRGHFSNTCPLPQFPNNDLCMRCHAKVHLSDATCPNMDADMKDWACMTYIPKKPATTALKPRTVLDAYYDQRRQEEESSTQHNCSYCNQPGHLTDQCPARQHFLDCSAFTDNPPLPTPSIHTITFNNQMQSIPPP